MQLDLSRIGQVALSVADADEAEAFYGTILGLPKIFRFDDLIFFDCAGTRLMIEKARDPAHIPSASVIYFRCDDIALAHRELAAKGVPFVKPPHLVASMADHDLWMAFFTDPDGHSLALMHEAPKGYTPDAL